MNNENKARAIISNLYGWNCKLISITDQDADHKTIEEALNEKDKEIEALREIIAIASPWIQRCPHDGLVEQKYLILKQIEEALSEGKESK